MPWPWWFLSYKRPLFNKLLIQRSVLLLDSSSSNYVFSHDGRKHLAAFYLFSLPVIWLTDVRTGRRSLNMLLLLMTGEWAREVGLLERPEESVSLLFWNPTNVSALFLYREMLFFLLILGHFCEVEPLSSTNLIEWSCLLAKIFFFNQVSLLKFLSSIIYVFGKIVIITRCIHCWSTL